VNYKPSNLFLLLSITISLHGKLIPAALQTKSMVKITELGGSPFLLIQINHLDIGDIFPPK